MTFRDLVLTIEVTKKERSHFIYVCSDWSLFCTSIAQFDKWTILKLIRYLIDERPNGNRLLARCIGRFNRLNALKRRHLDVRKTNRKISV